MKDSLGQWDAFQRNVQAQANDGGDTVELWAYDDYGDSPAVLSFEMASELHAWLTAWLERAGPAGAHPAGSDKENHDVRD